MSKTCQICKRTFYGKSAGVIQPRGACGIETCGQASCQFAAISRSALEAIAAEMPYDGTCDNDVHVSIARDALRHAPRDA